MNCFTRENGNVTGFYDPATQTYSALDTLTKKVVKPRLSGLLGKTIKKLIPTYQYAGLDGINECYNVPPSPRYLAPINGLPNCLDYIMPYNNTSPVNYYIEYGFFNDSTGESTRKYFMIINRYYSEASYHEIGLKSLGGFINWKLTNYVDSISTTLQAIDGKAYFHATIHIGDAKLYRAIPVVLYGGDLSYNETISGTNTLDDTMTIESGATLTISGTYNTNANILLKREVTSLLQQEGILTFPMAVLYLYLSADKSYSNNTRIL